MNKIIRREFVGNWFYFWLLCITIIGIPFAILYLVNGTLSIEHEVEKAEEFVRQFRDKKK